MHLVSCEGYTVVDGSQMWLIDPCSGGGYQSFDAQEVHKTLAAALSRI